MKRILVLGVMVFAIGATSITTFAASQYKNPLEMVAGVTGRTVESIASERMETGKTYGTIANEAGKLEEYKQERLAMKKDRLNEQIAAGVITQDEADAIYKAMEDHQGICDGTGGGKRCSSGKRTGCGNGGRGQGWGRGQGQGRRAQSGTCLMVAN